VGRKGGRRGRGGLVRGDGNGRGRVKREGRRVDCLENGLRRRSFYQCDGPLAPTGLTTATETCWRIGKDGRGRP
jgi:hypothetical protein